MYLRISTLGQSKKMLQKTFLTGYALRHKLTIHV